MKPKKPKIHTPHHSGTILLCMDRRVTPDKIVKSVRKKIPKKVLEDLKASYGHESAGNKAFEKDNILAGALQLGLGNSEGLLTVFGHSGVCGGMNAQHELHKLKIQRNNKKLRELKKQPIHGFVAKDLKLFEDLLLKPLRKKFGSKTSFNEFVLSPAFRELSEEFNVMLQLSKLIKRKDFRKYNSRGKIKLMGGIYIPKEKTTFFGKTVPVQGRSSFDFPHLYKLFGVDGVNELLSKLGLEHKQGEWEFKIKK